MSELRIIPVGERAILVEFGSDIRPDIQASVSALDQALTAARHPALTEWVPTYRSVLVHYDPLKISADKLTDWLCDLCRQPVETTAVLRRRVTIPVLYGSEMGPDLPFVAEHTKLSTEEVVRLHTQPDYLVYMLGFLPGFPYLGGLPPALITPRLATPRTTVPAGSVGIADRQTGVYPLNSPGGWQLIGRTPVRLYDAHSEQPFLLRPGDLLRFQSVTPDEYREVEQQVKLQCYQPLVEEGVRHEQH